METLVILFYYDNFSQYLRDYYPNIFRKFTIGLNVKNISVSIFLNIYNSFFKLIKAGGI